MDASIASAKRDRSRVPYAGTVTEPAGQVIRRSRPLGVALVALFLLADAVVTALEMLGRLSDLGDRGPLLDASNVGAGLLAVLAILKIAAAVGLWVGSRRAWVLTMLLVGVSLLLLIALHLGGVDEPRYVRLAINVVIAFYLNQGLVRDYFEPRQDVASEPAAASR